jgi:alpha-amylase
MDTPIAPAFTSLAYALILLREAGYPCVFYGDIYGMRSPHYSERTCGGKLADLILARKLYAYGEQEDYFLSPDFIGWVRKGVAESGDHRAAGMAVVMRWVGPSPRSTSPQSSSFHHKPGWFKRLSEKFGLGHASENQLPENMNVGRDHAGEIWTDILGHSKTRVTISHDGLGLFHCPHNTVSIYVPERAEGRNQFPVRFNSDIYSM